MSNSRKKNLFSGHTCKESEKFNKQKSNRAFRLVTKIELKKQRDTFSLLREVSNVWCFGKDGKKHHKDDFWHISRK